MARLTPTELHHLSLACQGLSAAETADRLSVAYETVRNHRRHIRKKLGVASMLAACAIAHRDNLV